MHGTRSALFALLAASTAFACGSSEAIAPSADAAVASAPEAGSVTAVDAGRDARASDASAAPAPFPGEWTKVPGGEACDLRFANDPVAAAANLRLAWTACAGSDSGISDCSELTLKAPTADNDVAVLAGAGAPYLHVRVWLEPGGAQYDAVFSDDLEPRILVRSTCGPIWSATSDGIAAFLKPSSGPSLAAWARWSDPHAPKVELLPSDAAGASGFPARVFLHGDALYFDAGSSAGVLDLSTHASHVAPLPPPFPPNDLHNHASVFLQGYPYGAGALVLVTSPPSADQAPLAFDIELAELRSDGSLATLRRAPRPTCYVQAATYDLAAQEVVWVESCVNPVAVSLWKAPAGADGAPLQARAYGQFSFDLLTQPDDVLANRGTFATISDQSAEVIVRADGAGWLDRSNDGAFRWIDDRVFWTTGAPLARTVRRKAIATLGQPTLQLK